MATALKTYTAAEAAAILKVTPFEVTRLCRERVIPAHKPGKSWLIFETDLLAYIEGATEQASA